VAPLVRKRRNAEGSVAIGKPERQVRKAASNNNSHIQLRMISENQG